jgi:hypothetical protein
MDFRSPYPAVMFENVGDSVSGRIVGVERYEEGVRVDLETDPRDEASKVTLWCQGTKLTEAVGSACRAADVSTLTVGDDLAVTFTGYDGRPKIYDAVYRGHA